MKIWFMYSCHTFAEVDEVDRNALIERALALFDQDGAGSMFVHDENDATVHSLTLHGRLLARIGKHGLHHGVDFSDLEAWADKVIAERSLRTLTA